MLDCICVLNDVLLEIFFFFLKKMNVKGFSTLFLSSMKKEKLSLKNFLLINSSDYLFSIIKLFSTKKFSYKKLKKIIKKKLIKLLKLNFFIYFFISNKRTQFKTLKKIENKKKWENYWEYKVHEEEEEDNEEIEEIERENEKELDEEDEEDEEDEDDEEEEKCDENDYENFPIPCLCLEQLIITLLSFKLTIYFCNGEVNQEINQTNQSAYCYTANRSHSFTFFSLFFSVFLDSSFDLFFEFVVISF